MNFFVNFSFVYLEIYIKTFVLKSEEKCDAQIAIDINSKVITSHLKISFSKKMLTREST